MHDKMTEGRRRFDLTDYVEMKRNVIEDAKKARGSYECSGLCNRCSVRVIQSTVPLIETGSVDSYRIYLSGKSKANRIVNNSGSYARQIILENSSVGEIANMPESENGSLFIGSDSKVGNVFYYPDSKAGNITVSASRIGSLELHHGSEVGSIKMGENPEYMKHFNDKSRPRMPKIERLYIGSDARLGRISTRGFSFHIGEFIIEPGAEIRELDFNPQYFYMNPPCTIDELIVRGNIGKFRGKVPAVNKAKITGKVPVTFQSHI